MATTLKIVYLLHAGDGCKVEKLQLETQSRFDSCLTLYMIIAWRILYLTMLARECPDASCHIIFTEEKRKVAYMMGLDYKGYGILLRLKISMTVLRPKKLIGNDVLNSGQISLPLSSKIPASCNAYVTFNLDTFATLLAPTFTLSTSIS